MKDDVSTDEDAVHGGGTCETVLVRVNETTILIDRLIVRPEVKI